MKKINLMRTVSTALLVAGLAFTAGTASADDFKVGFVYVGPTGDHGWTYRHDEGRKVLEAMEGVTTTFVESVAEGADAERVIRQLASKGNDMVFTTSFGYMNPTLKVAKKFPKVKFEHATGYKRGKNISTYSGRFYEGRAILGTIAGHMTKSNTVGYIASMPIPEVIRGINSFTIAMRKVNPKAEVKVIWVNSWYDPGKEGDAAKALIDQGADIITQHTDSPAPLQVAEKRGVFGFGQASDMSAFAPKSQLTAIVDDWGPYYKARVEAAIAAQWESANKDGMAENLKALIDSSLPAKWESMDTWAGIKDGMVHMAPYSDLVPADVQKAADAVKAGIVDGTMHPFAGPIKNQKGEVVVKEGETVSDGDLLGMNWYVEGVQGSVPK